jgi:transposase InsO family protein
MSEQRKSLVEEIKFGEQGISALCRKYGVSRPTAYKWLERNDSCGSFESRSRAPLHSPGKTCPSVESLILRTRELHPCWGGRKLKAYLERAGEARVPSASTITAILHRNGFVSKEASLAAKPFKRFEMDSPNDLWQTDFKGHFAMGNGSRCHPLTVTDDMSRFSLCISAKGNEQLEGVLGSFLSLFKEHGLPKAVLCDNGPPWGFTSVFGYTKFEVFLMDRGVLPVHGKPLHPQTQGKEERFHRTLKCELLRQILIRDLPHAQKEFDSFRKMYNEERPHCSLGYAVPADRYKNSERPMPEKIDEWEYPEGCEIKWVRANGCIRFKNKDMFLSEAFYGLNVALMEEQENGFMDIIYRNFKIATIDLKKGRLCSKKITRLGKKCK